MTTEAYIELYNFVKPKLNPKFLHEFNLDDDIKNNVLNIFENKKTSKFIEHMTEEEFINYLDDINLFICSFYKYADYKLSRLYNKLNNDEKIEFKQILIKLNTSSNLIIKKISDEIFEKSRINEKIAYLTDKITGLKNNNTPDVIASLFDDIFLDEPLRNYFIENIKEKLINANLYFSLIEDLVNTCVEEFYGMEDILLLIMKINPVTKIYKFPTRYQTIKTYITEVIMKSVYLLNIFCKIDKNYIETKDIKDNNKVLFKRRYEIITSNDEKYLINKDVLKEFNTLDNFLDNLTLDKNIIFNSIQFKSHLTLLLLKVLQIVVSLKQIHFHKQVVETIHKSIEVEFKSKKEKLELQTYVETLLYILNSGDVDKVSLLINYCKNNKERLLEIIQTNKEVILENIMSLLNDNGMNRSKEILNFLRKNLDLNQIISKYLNDFDENQETENRIKQVLSILIKLFNIVNAKINIQKIVK